MIRSWNGKHARAVWNGTASKGFPPDIRRRAEQKLQMLDSAVMLDDLRVPNSNRLEALRGDRRGQHAVWINAQWRVCFRWRDGDAYDVEIVDYH